MKSIHGADLQRGVGLIEVLVALIVISVGLLGVAKMEGLALANTGIANKRSVAAIQAASLASTMHANPRYWAGGVAPASITVTGTTVSDSTLTSQTADCTTVTCTPIQMAAFDIKKWATSTTSPSLYNLLPGYSATVACSQTTNVPVTCTIQINWIEHSVSMNNNATQGNTEQAPTYTLYVEP